VHDAKENPRWLRWLDALAVATAAVIVVVAALALAAGDTAMGVFLIALAIVDVCAVAWARRRRAVRER
jgi:hypothetical protein